MKNPSFDLRIRLLNLYFKAKCGHIGSSLSCIDLLYVLFKEKKKSEKVILSKGHAAGALYIVLNEIGEISTEELDTFYGNSTKLAAHPSANSFENIPFATGSLGHGLPIATGIAISDKIFNEDKRIFVVMSDGETNEGTTWEAAHFAVQNKLDNLFIIIDKNLLQGFGNTNDVIGDTANVNTWSSIGFECVEIDGHNLEEFRNSIYNFTDTNKPKLIIAKTTKGKGVSYMENNLAWHYLPMDDYLFEEAIDSLKKQYNA